MLGLDYNNNHLRRSSVINNNNNNEKNNNFSYTMNNNINSLSRGNSRSSGHKKKSTMQGISSIGDNG